MPVAPSRLNELDMKKLLKHLDEAYSCFAYKETSSFSNVGSHGWTATYRVLRVKEGMEDKVVNEICFAKSILEEQLKED